MSAPRIQLSKADARRALCRYHFEETTFAGALERLRSVQFDPLAPVGSNHDLVLQARVPGYKVGDWAHAAYTNRSIYDGWDKQASLVPIEGWPLRRVFHTWHRHSFRRIFDDHGHAIDAVLSELQSRGPLLPKEFEFQERKDEWKGSWFGPNLTKQTLRALWHAGHVMTAGRRNGHHVYDLTERVVPAHLRDKPNFTEKDAFRELAYERHLATGLLRPSASYEVWSLHVPNAASGQGWGLRSIAVEKKDALDVLVESGRIVPIEIEGMAAHATPEFLSMMDSKQLEPRVIFVAPLDQLMWDRKMVAHVFGFDYVWEVYVPEQKRIWGYYVLPVLFDDELVARVEFWCRDGVLEVRKWHWESGQSGSPKFWTSFESAVTRFMAYAGASIAKCSRGVDKSVASVVKQAKPR